MTCIGSLVAFSHKSDTCRGCENLEECKASIIKKLVKLNRKKDTGKILKVEKSKPNRKLPEIREDLPVVVKQKLTSLYRRGFSYQVGQVENPFGYEDPCSYGLIYDELFNRQRMSKMDIRRSIMDKLGWSNQSAKVEVSKIICILTETGIAKMDGNVLMFLS